MQKSRRSGIAGVAGAAACATEEHAACEVDPFDELGAFLDDEEAATRGETQAELISPSIMGCEGALQDGINSAHGTAEEVVAVAAGIAILGSDDATHSLDELDD